MGGEDHITRTVDEKITLNVMTFVCLVIPLACLFLSSTSKKVIKNGSLTGSLGCPGGDRDDSHWSANSDVLCGTASEPDRGRAPGVQLPYGPLHVRGRHQGVSGDGRRRHCPSDERRHHRVPLVWSKAPPFALGVSYGFVSLNELNKIQQTLLTNKQGPQGRCHTAKGHQRNIGDVLNSACHLERGWS